MTPDLQDLLQSDEIGRSRPPPGHTLNRHPALRPFSTSKQRSSHISTQLAYQQTSRSSMNSAQALYTKFSSPLPSDLSYRRAGKVYQMSTKKGGKALGRKGLGTGVQKWSTKCLPGVLFRRGRCPFFFGFAGILHKILSVRGVIRSCHGDLCQSYPDFGINSLILVS